HERAPHRARLVGIYTLCKICQGAKRKTPTRTPGFWFKNPDLCFVLAGGMSLTPELVAHEQPNFIRLIVDEHGPATRTLVAVIFIFGIKVFNAKKPILVEGVFDASAKSPPRVSGEQQLRVRREELRSRLTRPCGPYRKVQKRPVGSVTNSTAHRGTPIPLCPESLTRKQCWIGLIKVHPGPIAFDTQHPSIRAHVIAANLRAACDTGRVIATLNQEGGGPARLAPNPANISSYVTAAPVVRLRNRSTGLRVRWSVGDKGGRAVQCCSGNARNEKLFHFNSPQERAEPKIEFVNARVVIASATMIPAA